MSVLRSELGEKITEATNRMLRWTVGTIVPGFGALAWAVIAVG